MVQPKLPVIRDPAFDPFLFAVVGEVLRSDSVTVLSMLVRLNIDPWLEAAELAAMPIAHAQQRLETLLASFTDVPSVAENRSKTALELLKLLPQPHSYKKPTSGASATQLSLPPLGSMGFWIIAALLFIGWIIMQAQGT